ALHEAVRQFAGEKLRSEAGDEQATLDRHCTYFCQFLSDKEKNVRGYQQARGFVEIRGEIENARSAFLRAVAQRKTREIAISASCLGTYLVMQGMGRQQADTIDKALDLWRADGGMTD